MMLPLQELSLNGGTGHTQKRPREGSMSLRVLCGEPGDKHFTCLFNPHHKPERQVLLPPPSMGGNRHRGSPEKQNQ